MKQGELTKCQVLREIFLLNPPIKIKVRIIPHFEDPYTEVK